MTRINCVPVECLSDKHLLAEFKEITRPFGKVLKRIEKYGIENALNDIPVEQDYRLNKGHEGFFFDKLYWLHHRYSLLFSECNGRGFKVSFEKYWEIHEDFREKLSETPYWNWWKPTPEDMYLNMARLTKRCKWDNVHEELNSEK